MSVFAFAALSMLALPPHAFDEVFGNKPVDPSTAAEKILDSRPFHDVVSRAIAKAQRPAGKIGPTFEQRVRESIANQLSASTKDEPADEDDPRTKRALPPHELDAACKSDRPGQVIRNLRKSKAFVDAVKRACEGVEPLPPKAAGATSGQQMRVNLSREFSLP